MTVRHLLEIDDLSPDELGDVLDRASHRQAPQVLAGRTVLFVSHNLEQTAALCDPVIWLEQGEIAGLGKASEILPAYEASLRAHAEAVSPPR